ncbi:hypothetical protein E6O75_ATG07059 [Venturia nashicola]|uniref:Glycine zipper 2TM domain-containing protein n=1 Tax=Venturia nashicola TaxID=86259 RepID=A0A4Z1PEH3_9PEZI|nr:hypothetical protein E6O75_ATG07059 [Venturia nashicola]
MADDFAELGLEGFDRLVDRYHDTAHDHAVEYGHKMHRPKKWHKNPHGETVQVEEESHPEAERASSEPRAEPKGEPPRRRGENHLGDSEDPGHASEVQPRRRPRRYSGNESRSESVNHAQRRKPYANENPGDHGHLYPPPPGQNMSYEYQQMPRTQPYAGQQMQPYAGQQMQPNAGQQLQPYSSQQVQPYSGQQQPLYSVPLAVPGAYEMSQHRSQSSRPHENRRRHDHDRRFSPPPRRRRSHRDSHRDGHRDSHRDGRRKSLPKDSSLGASLAGALAGGLIGHQAGKGDVFSTAAGALVGAVSGSIAAEKHSKNKDKRRNSGY